jgi:hypothetical protein
VRVSVLWDRSYPAAAGAAIEEVKQQEIVSHNERLNKVESIDI